MRCFRLSLLIVAVCLYFTATVSAELSNCDGVWTDRPCEGVKGQTVAPVPEKAPPSPEKQLFDSKRLLLQELVSASYDARSNFGIEFSTRSVEKGCEPATVSLSQCEKLVQAAHDRLLSLIAVATKVNEENDRQKVEVNSNQYNTNITIIENDPFYQDPAFPLPPGPFRPGKPGQHNEGPFQGYGSRWK